MSTEQKLVEARNDLAELEKEYKFLIKERDDVRYLMKPLQERLTKAEARLRDFGHGFYKQSSKLKTQKDRIEAIEKQLLIESHPKAVWKCPPVSLTARYISRVTEKRIYLSTCSRETYYSKQNGVSGKDTYWGILDVDATIKAWEDFKSE